MASGKTCVVLSKRGLYTKFLRTKLPVAVMNQYLGNKLITTK